MNRFFSNRIARGLNTLVLTVFFGVSLSGPASAAVIGTQDYLRAEGRPAQLARVTAVLAREDVQRYLIRQGVDPEAARERVMHLTDAELARLAQALDGEPAGGSVLGLIGAVFVVLLILELTGVTNIFTNI